MPVTPEYFYQESRLRHLDSPRERLGGPRCTACLPSGSDLEKLDWPLKTCLHAEAQRFGLSAEAAAQTGTQACGNDSSLFRFFFEPASRHSRISLSEQK